MKLLKDEVEQIHTIISEFTALHKEFDSYETELENMQKKQSEILEKLTSVNEKITELRAKEMNLIQTIKEKYGEGSLDLETMEYTVE